jgi:hypothetical protein
MFITYTSHDKIEWPRIVTPAETILNRNQRHTGEHAQFSGGHSILWNLKDERVEEYGVQHLFSWAISVMPPQKLVPFLGGNFTDMHYFV